MTPWLLELHLALAIVRNDKPLAEAIAKHFGDTLSPREVRAMARRIESLHLGTLR